MGFLDTLRRIFGKKSDASKSIESSVNRSGDIHEELPITYPSEQITKLSPSEEIDKESFQMGLAAGYTGRSIKAIESSIERMESQMVSKDWFSIKIYEFEAKIMEIIRKQEENNQKRYETIQKQLLFQPTEPVKPSPETPLPLTPKMQWLIQVVKDFNEISYQDLAHRLGITVSALRGLLSNTIARTNKLQRLRKKGKGWVRYVEGSIDASSDLTIQTQ